MGRRPLVAPTVIFRRLEPYSRCPSIVRERHDLDISWTSSPLAGTTILRFGRRGTLRSGRVWRNGSRDSRVLSKRLWLVSEIEAEAFLELETGAAAKSMLQVGHDRMNNRPDPCDYLLRATIKEYRRMAEGAKRDAADCESPSRRERYLALAKSLIELADSLESGPSN